MAYGDPIYFTDSDGGGNVATPGMANYDVLASQQGWSQYSSFCA